MTTSFSIFCANRGFQRLDFGANLFRLALPFDGFGAIFGLLPFRRHRNVLASRQAGEECPQSVIVLLKDRVEFVIVTAGAAHAEAENCIADRVGQIIEDRVPLAGHVALIVFVAAGSQETGRDQGVRIVRCDLVAGQLLLDEAVIRLVGIETPDDVVAVARAPARSSSALNPSLSA